MFTPSSFLFSGALSIPLPTPLRAAPLPHYRGSCKTPRGMGVPPMKHGQDARATPVGKGFCKTLYHQCWSRPLFFRAGYFLLFCIFAFCFSPCVLSASEYKMHPTMECGVVAGWQWTSRMRTRAAWRTRRERTGGREENRTP